MKKKFLALVLTLAMVLSLVPVTALAAGATPTPDVVDGYYNDNDEGKWTSGKLENAIPEPLKDTVTIVNKTAEKVADQDNQYDVTLTVQMKHKETAVPPGAAATVLVIDTSGSMNYCTKEEHQHTDACYQWEKCTPQNNPTHYNGKYHKVGIGCKLTMEGYFHKVLTCTKEVHKHSDQTCGTPRRLAAAKDAAKNFLNSYRGGTVSEGSWTPSTTPLKRYISVVWFNKGVSSSEWLDVSTQDGYDKAIRSINDLSAIEGTNLDAGLRMADAQLNNNTVKDMPADVVVLTDGKPTYYLTEATFLPSVEIGSGQYWIMNDGQDCTQNTYDQTVSTAQSLRSSVSGGVYTVCFGASSEILSLVDGKPTVGTFLQEKVATQPEAGSTQKYAYEAQDADDLNRVFAAISSSVVSGLNTGKVTDTLPNGVSCTDGTFGEGRTLTWELKADDATQSPADSNGFITYTYEKTYKVEIDPAAEGLYVVDGYVPLNLPTKLTVKNSDNRDVDIPFPIPAGKVTYSLTNFNKELVTKSDTLSFDTNGFIIPDTKDSTVTVGKNGVTLLYKITVEGNPGAKFTVTDTGATLVSPTDTITPGDNSTFSGTVDTTGTTVFYVSKKFTQENIVTSGDTKSVSNTARIDPGDNAKGPAETEKTKTVTTPAKEPDPQTYTVTYRWAEGETPSDANTLLPQGGTFTVGQKHTVEDVPQSSVKTNAAGKTGTWSCTWDRSDTIEGTANQEIVITGTWTFTENKPTTGNLIVKKVVSGESLTLNDLPTGSKEFKITVSGNGESKELSLKDSGVNVNESKTEATWTIRDLPAGEYTVSESDADVDGYDCTATYSATNDATVTVNGTASAVQNQPATDTQTSQKVTVTENQTSTMTVTNKYKKQEVEPTPDTSKPDVNKTATALVNDKTDVTLSVGGKSAKENVAVMFLLDKSTSMGTRTEAAKMLQHLRGLTNTNIIYDVIIFSGTASSTGWQDISKDAEYTNTLNNFADRAPSSGTNMPVGIDQAIQDMKTLNSEYSSYAGNAYLITISDGITYLWNEEGTTYTVPLLGEANIVHKNVDTWDMMHGKGTSIADVYTSFEGFLNTIPRKIEQTRNDDYVQEYLTGTNALQIPTADPEKSQVSDTYACAPEFSVYYSATKYQEELVKQFEKSFALPMPELDENKQNKMDNWESWYPWGKELMLYLQSNSSNSGQGVVYAADAEQIFAGIQNKILYQIQSGSITDVIGADFSLTDQTLTQNTFTLTVNGKAVTANAPSGNVITFGNANEDGQYPYVLTYYKGTAAKNEDNTYTITSTSGNKSYTYTPCDKTGEVNGSVSDEFFVLEMKVPVVSLDLKYNLSLTSKRTASGTYEVPTNESATLEYTSANQSSGTVDFNEPTVSYRIKGSSGGHGGGTVTIPDDVPTGLNGKDHYAYVVGYPDGMVYPQKNITRAEVATIFFRLLKDETREANMTKSNGYNDMKDGAWYTCAVSTLSKMGIIKGYEDGSFKPDASISRAEFAAIAARFDPDGDKTPATFSDVSSHWAKDEISIAANHGWIKGYEDGSFKPDQKITRAETMTLVNRVLKRLPETKDDLHKDMKTWPDNQNESAWFYLAVQEATNSHYQKLKKDGIHETWESMRETRDWAALEK